MPIALTGVFALFLGFTIYASARENFWKSCRAVFALLWGRQVVADLYIGIFLFHIFVYLQEGSLLVTALWLVPSLVLGNLVPLVYLITHFAAISGRF